MSYNNQIKIAILTAGADAQGVSSRYLNEARLLPDTVVKEVSMWNHKKEGKIEKLEALQKREASLDDFIINKEKNIKDSDVHFDYSQDYARQHILFEAPQNETDYESSMGRAVEGAKYIYVSPPSSHLRSVLHTLSKVVKEGQIVIIRSKGAEYKETNNSILIYAPYQIAKEELAGKGTPKFIEGGLNFSSEIINNVFQYSMISTGTKKGDKDNFRQKLINETKNDLKARGYVIKDSRYLVTPQLSWIFKNIGAMAAGVTSGYNLKYNDPINYDAESVRLNLVQSFMSNLVPIVYEMGGNTNAWNSIPVSVTDFLGTSLSENSRNFRAGKLKAQGKSLEEIADEIKMTIEGIAQLKQINKIVEKRSDLDPAGIIKSIYDIFYNEANIGEIINKVSNLDQEHYRKGFWSLRTIQTKGPFQDLRAKSEPIKINLH